MARRIKEALVLAVYLTTRKTTNRMHRPRAQRATLPLIASRILNILIPFAREITTQKTTNKIHLSTRALLLLLTTLALIASRILKFLMPFTREMTTQKTMNRIHL
jgi:hypothetical protein